MFSLRIIQLVPLVGFLKVGQVRSVVSLRPGNDLHEIQLTHPLQRISCHLYKYISKRLKNRIDTKINDYPFGSAYKIFGFSHQVTNIICDYQQGCDRILNNKEEKHIFEILLKFVFVISVELIIEQNQNRRHRKQS